MNAKNRVTGMLFTAPAFVIYSFFIIISVLTSFYYSFNSWNGVGPLKWVGLNNFIYMIKDPDFLTVLFNTLIMIVWSLFIQIPMGCILAYLIYRTTRGFRVFRTAFFLPVVIAPAAVGMMFTLILNSDIGPINKLAAQMGLNAIANIQWLTNPNVVLYSVMFPMIWQYIGFYFVLFLAGMQTIPEELFESALLDGANAFQTFWRISIPMLSEFFKITIIWCIAGGFKVFDYPYIMTWGGPGLRSAYLGLFMYRKAFINTDFGYGSTLGISILVLSLVCTLLFRKLTEKIEVSY